MAGKVRGPQRRKVSTKMTNSSEENLRLTLTITPDDMAALEAVANHNLRSMSAQALYYIRQSVMSDFAALPPKKTTAA